MNLFFAFTEMILALRSSASVFALFFAAVGLEARMTPSIGFPEASIAWILYSVVNWAIGELTLGDFVLPETAQSSVCSYRIRMCVPTYYCAIKVYHYCQ